MQSSAQKYRLDWKLQILKGLLNRSQPIELLSPEALRQRNETSRPAVIDWLKHGRKRKLPKVRNQWVTGRHGNIPIRLYYPSLNSPLPCVVFFHGGGWVTGNLGTHDAFCRQIAYQSGALVLSVAYRLAPEFPYPTPLEDCYDATQWAAQNADALGADPRQLMVMGDSAGGNLAAAVCLMARDLEGPNLQKQILLYPALDGTLNHPSMDQYADAPVLKKTAMEIFINQYANSPADIQSPYFSPLLAETLNHLPSALVITAAYDPLRDEGQAYAQRLQQAGVPTQVTDYPGMVHGFLSFPRFCSGAKLAWAEITQYLQAATSPNCSPTDSLNPLAKSPPD
ncbi:alpha/beta hydrolase [Acaryochloris marina]|uniref:alpha/beta hydrolase n=1 Tax=Acaryochloris marina TaxID=155978 RepID=UPI0005A234DA|nr:alpha/beta hydrolase [Acaryochloris marina]